MLAPRLTAVVVLPTPPFWFATARTVPIGAEPTVQLGRKGVRGRTAKSCSNPGLTTVCVVQAGSFPPDRHGSVTRAGACAPSRRGAGTRAAWARSCGTRADAAALSPDRA